MTMTSITKKVGVGIVLAMILTLLFAFYTQPIFADAKGIGGTNVQVTASGALTVSGEDFADGSTNAWKNLFSKYKNFIVGIAGVATISMLLFFIINFMKLGATAGNPQARSQALGGVLWTGIATACLGAVTIIVGFFYNSVG